MRLDRAPNKLCHGRHGLCSRTGKPHIHFTGMDPKSKRLWTKIAEPYPSQLCSPLWAMIRDSTAQLHTHRINSLLVSSTLPKRGPDVRSTPQQENRTPSLGPRHCTSLPKFPWLHSNRLPV